MTDMTTETPATTPTDEFADAFARFSTEMAQEGEEPAKEPQPAEPAAESEQPAAEPAAESAQEEPAQETPAEAPAEAPKESDDALLARLAALVNKTPQPEPAQQQVEQQAPEPQPVLSEDDQKFYTEYQKDWPDVARGERMARMQEYPVLVQHVFNEIQKVYGPAMEAAIAAAQQLQYQQLTQELPDYSDDLREQVEAWADRQPDYLQSAYKHVIDRGTPQQVVDLVKRYRQETGSSSPPPPVAPASSPAVRRETELPAAAKKAAASLAPVSSKRSSVSETHDPNDFDGAWAQAAKMLQGI
jgi:uncharacterized phage infection (PIP) family protein YhgE